MPCGKISGSGNHDPDRPAPATTFAYTLIRVKDSRLNGIHIDSVEANAAGVVFGPAGERLLNTEHKPNTIIGTSHHVR